MTRPSLGWCVLDLRDIDEATFFTSLPLAEGYAQGMEGNAAIVPCRGGSQDRPHDYTASANMRAGLRLQARIGQLSNKVARQAEQISALQYHVQQAKERARRTIRESRVGQLEEENKKLRRQIHSLMRASSED